MEVRKSPGPFGEENIFFVNIPYLAIDGSSNGFSKFMLLNYFCNLGYINPQSQFVTKVPVWGWPKQSRNLFLDLVKGCGIPGSQWYFSTVETTLVREGVRWIEKFNLWLHKHSGFGTPRIYLTWKYLLFLLVPEALCSGYWGI